MRTLFNIAALVSTLCSCTLLVMCFAASSVDPARQFVSLSSSVHVSIDMRGFGPHLEVFNDVGYGPYHGSIIGVGAPGWPSQVKSNGLSFPGVYYRYFRWADGSTLWTFAIGLVYLVVLSGVVPVAWLVHRSRRAWSGFPMDARDGATVQTHE